MSTLCLPSWVSFSSEEILDLKIGQRVGIPIIAGKLKSSKGMRLFPSCVFLLPLSYVPLFPSPPLRRYKDRTRLKLNDKEEWNGEVRQGAGQGRERHQSEP